MKITVEDKAKALAALANAYCVAMRVFQAVPDEDTIVAWDVMRSIDELQQYIDKAEIVDKYT